MGGVKRCNLRHYKRISSGKSLDIIKASKVPILQSLGIRKTNVPHWTMPVKALFVNFE